MGLQLAEVVGLNLTGGMSVCCECCVLSGRDLQQANQLSRRRLQCLRWGLHEATLCATHQQIQSPTSERAGRKLVMPITHRNEKARH